MPQRKCTKTNAFVTSQDKRIVLPIAMEHYLEIIDDAKGFRAWVDNIISQHPELFPAGIAQGYVLHDGCSP